MKNNKIWKIIFAGIGVAVLLIAGYWLWTLLDKKEIKETSIPAQDLSNTVLYQGKEYEYNSDLKNILFVGIDQTDMLTEQETPGTAGQADCILLVSMDRTSETAKVVQISRDTMTDVDLYDVSGNYSKTIRKQIATQYAYANGGKSSSWAMKKAVSRLFYDLPIDGTIAMNIEGIRAITDSVGGVTLTIPEDYTVIDPAFTAGTTVTLNGEQAEKYIRYRNTDETGSNNDRMKRQTQFVPELLKAVKATAGEDGNYYETFSGILDPYMILDMSAKDVDELAEYGLASEDIYTVPGEVQAGAEHDEFIINEEELYEMVINMFYRPVETADR